MRQDFQEAEIGLERKKPKTLRNVKNSEKNVYQGNRQFTLEHTLVRGML